MGAATQDVAVTAEEEIDSISKLCVRVLGSFPVFHAHWFDFMCEERRLPSRPNQALQPTATAVMHPADAGCPPAAAVADL